MDYYRNSADEMVICPYDKTHVIRKGRLSSHLIKCAKNNKALLKNFTSCEYNHAHRIKRDDGSKHYEHCEENWYDEWLERYNKCTKKRDTSLPNFKEFRIPSEENLDEELEPFCGEHFHGPVPDIKKITVTKFVRKKGDTSLPNYNEIQISFG